MGTIGVIANPRSGSDVRRVIAAAASSTLEEKISIIRRVVLGARQVGASRFLFHRDPHGLARRSTETMRGIDIGYVDFDHTYDERDSVEAARAMRDAGCEAVVVLGGDGTNRAVAKGWPDVVVLPLSTGTNNAFPFHVEPTVAGAAIGLAVTGAVDLDTVARVAKVVRVSVDGEDPDLALIDAVVADDPYVGSLELFDPATIRLAVLTRADPAAIGFSAAGGLLAPCSPGEDLGIVVRFDDSSSTRVRAPTAPGHYADIGIAGVERIALGTPVCVEGPTLFAFDGERKRRLKPGRTAELRVCRDGPRVVDVTAVMQAAAERGLFRVTSGAAPHTHRRRAR